MNNHLYYELENELNSHIMPFWTKLKDEVHGGFYGGVDYDLRTDPYAEKGGIAASRLLWAFSAAYRVTKQESYLTSAEHAYQFLANKVVDHEHQGLYWMLDYMGNPKDTRKHVYAQSFGVYSLSEYYLASKNEHALNLAKQLFELIEEKGYDTEAQAYREEFNRVWQEQPNEMLSENGIIADITMNTHIHILEAYTTLYVAWPDARVRMALERLLRIMYEKIYNHETKFLGVFFNRQWHSLIDLKSFGHDIEASWLIDKALKTLKMDKPEYVKMVVDIAYNIANYAIQEDGSLINEEHNGKLDKTRVWWVQAEAIVGFYNAFERTQDEQFLRLAHKIWSYTKQHIIDQREHGEWFWSILEDGTPTAREINGPWKCPYHNSRLCIEMMERMNNHDS